jgi:Protein O-mannosyl-transferase TMEM260-like
MTSLAFLNDVRRRHGDSLANMVLPFLVAVSSLLVYSLTLAPDLTWAHYGGDGGELITAAATLGVPHPPGYPTYVLLGKIVSLIPLGTTAWRFNLFSAVCAAAAAGFVTASAKSVLATNRHGDVAAAAAGLSFAFTALIWQQAVITEVYTLNLLMLSICLFSLLSGAAPHVTGLFLGLGITTHLSSLIIMPLAFYLTPKAQWKSLGAGTVVGLLPLAAVPLLARSDSPVVWGDPSSLSRWAYHISGRLYYPNLRAPQSRSWLPGVFQLGGTILRQYAWVGWLFIILGAVNDQLGRRESAALLGTSLAYLIFAFFYQSDDSFVNLLPIFVLLSPLLAAGLARAGTLSLLFPIGLLLISWHSASLHGEKGPRPLAEQLLNSAPAEAVLITAGDRSIFALWYFQHVEDMREDLIIIDNSLLAFDWYRQRLGAQYPQLAALGDDTFGYFREQNGLQRPICEVPADLSGDLTCAGIR